MARTCRPSASAALALTLLATLAIAAPVAADQTFTVDTTADTVDASPGDGDCADAAGACSLRAAVMEANATVGHDTVSLPEGTYTLTIAGTRSDSEGDLDVNESLTVLATGSAVVQPGEGNVDRVFDMRNAGSSLTLQGFTIRNGHVDSDGGAVRFDGGDGTLTLGSMTFVDNVADGRSDGGAVFLRTGSLVIDDSTFSGNQAGDDGGAVSHGVVGAAHGTRPATISNSTFTGNRASMEPAEEGGNGGDGGAVHAVGPLTVTGSTFEDNDNSSPIGDNGGAIRSEADLTVESSTFVGNRTHDLGGAIETSAPQEGSTAEGADVTITGSTFQDNAVTSAEQGGDGGAIFSRVPLSLTRSSFSGNSAVDDGGALYATAATAVATTTFSGNTAADFGGAIEVDGTELTLRRSTLDGNAAKDGAGLSVDGDGTADLLNVTISGNDASDDGGGIHSAGTTTASFVTVARNDATDQGGGLYTEGGTITVRHSIVAENTAAGDANCRGTITPEATNLSDDGSCAGFTFTNEDPQLGALADNGGPTRTHALAGTSPAVDAASDCQTVAGTEVSQDQRGLQRPTDGDDDGTAECDLGAYEHKAAAAPEPGEPEQPEVDTVESLTVAPDESTRTLGDQHAVTVTVTDTSGQVVEGAQVRFEVAGANPATGAESTDDAGETTFTYTGTTVGTDTITACTNDDGSLPTSCGTASGPSDTATVTWEQPATDGAVTRLSGADRWLTAIEVSKATFADGSVDTVVLARGDNGENDNGFADALAGTPLAVKLGVPLLITTPDQLHAPVEDEIARLLGNDGRVILLGGSAALSAGVEARLDELGYVTDRLSGDDRVETALDIARATEPAPSAILISRGWAFPDALASGPAAAEARGVVVLNPDDRRSPRVDAYLDAHPEVPVFAIGGQIAALYPEATPVVGVDRFETAIEVAERFFERPETVGLARADTFPDSLAGGTHIGLAGGPLVLTLPPHLESEGLHERTESYLCATGSLTTGFVYGGEVAISPSTEQEFAARLAGEGC